MAKKNPAADPAPADTGFAPVPRRERHDGWTAERQRNFLEALAETGSVTAAAAEAGITPRSAYRLRAHPEAGAFAKAWDRALGVASGHLVALAFERAINGVPRQTWKNGELVQETRTPSDRLLALLLHQFERRRFGPYRYVDAFADRAPEHALATLPAALAELSDVDTGITLIQSWPDLRHAPDTGC